MRPVEAKNILIIKHGAFGDIMQADGALRDIRAAHPHAKITVLTMPAYARIFERCPHVNAVMLDERAPRWRLDRMYALKRRLRAAQFDMVYDLQNSSRTAYYFRSMLRETKWSGTAKGVSHPHRAKNPKDIPSLKRLEGQLRDAGILPRHALNPDLGWMAEDVTKLLREARVTKPFIVLVAGSSARHPKKRWPYYAELAERLREEGRCVVIAPGPDELNMQRKIPYAIAITGPRGFLNWFELAGLFKQADFVIGNDTGPTHLAAHLGVPGLALFGSHMSAERTGIERANFEALEVRELSSLAIGRVLDELHIREAEQPKK
jgi:ADP-heptose:LPS heptosyltransferase